MSDVTPEVVTPSTEPEAVVTPATAETARSFSQDEVNSLIAEQKRKIREGYADYDDLKTKAEKYAEVEARATALEQELNTTKYSALKNQIASETGVPVQMLTGETEESMREAAELLIAWKGVEKTPPPATRTVNQSGASSSPEVMTPQEKAAAALRALRS